MPNYFTLTPIGSKEPAKLTEIDKAMCEALGVKLHPKKWCHDWYNWAGEAFSVGMTYQQIGEAILKNEDISDRATYLSVIAFLKDRYTIDCWYQPR